MKPKELLRPHFSRYNPPMSGTGNKSIIGGVAPAMTRKQKAHLRIASITDMLGLMNAIKRNFDGVPDELLQELKIQTECFTEEVQKTVELRRSLKREPATHS
jgi:hypothetical protein